MGSSEAKGVQHAVRCNDQVKLTTVYFHSEKFLRKSIAKRLYSESTSYLRRQRSNLLRVKGVNM